MGNRPKPYNGVGERFFAKVNTELSDKGFLVAAADDLISWARTGSLLGARLRPRCACRYICARLSADGRGTALWRAFVAKKDSAHRLDRALISSKVPPAALLSRLSGLSPHVLFGQVELDWGRIDIMIPTTIVMPRPSTWRL